MKKVMGISLGSSKRDHAVTVSLLGQECRVERVGMDGDIERMIETIKALDGRWMPSAWAGLAEPLLDRPALSAARCAADHGERLG